ncbi:MAG: YicC/YloC family endoribonuclease [Flavobacteriales bacterium]
MIYSMTGFGKCQLNLPHANFNIEVKSLNSKQLDTNIKISSVYREKEIELKNLLSTKLKRGKIELSVWKESSEIQNSHKLNIPLIKDYHQQILNLKKDLGFESDIFPVLLKMPNILQKDEVKLDNNEWLEIFKGINTAVDELIQFRLVEGNKLEKDIILRINLIINSLEEITPYAKARIKRVKENLLNKINDLKINNIDENRLEQELIYYLEKQDITEEQVRLKAHLDYFIQTIRSEAPNGKKLGFISQEIGREINTIGSKSSDAEMQKIVVQMKDELEKIKEQLLNVL